MPRLPTAEWAVETAEYAVRACVSCSESSLSTAARQSNAILPRTLDEFWAPA